MTKEQEMMFEKEIYNVINTMKKADKNTREDLQIYIDGIKCALKFMGYDYDFNGESVRLWESESHQIFQDIGFSLLKRGMRLGRKKEIKK